MLDEVKHDTMESFARLEKPDFTMLDVVLFPQTAREGRYPYPPTNSVAYFAGMKVS